MGSCRVCGYHMKGIISLYKAQRNTARISDQELLAIMSLNSLVDLTAMAEKASLLNLYSLTIYAFIIYVIYQQFRSPDTKSSSGKVRRDIILANVASFTSRILLRLDMVQPALRSFSYDVQC